MPQSPLTEQDVKRIYQQSLPVNKGDFKTAFDRVARLVAVAREELTNYINTAIARLDQHISASEARINARLSEVKDGVSPDPNEITQTVLKQIRQPKDGETPIIDYQRIAQEAAALIPTPQNGTDADVQEAVRLTLPQVLAEIDKRVPLLGDALRVGLETYAKDIVGKTLINGGTSAVAVMQSGTLKHQTASYLNFKGSGAPTVTIGQNGVTNLDFPSGGGVGNGYQAPLSGVVDGSNTVFVWATAPNSIVVDEGRSMRKTKSDSSTNWTGTTTTTLAIAPTSDIYAVA